MVAGDEAAVRKLQELWSEKSLLERYGEVRFSVRMKPFAWGPFEVDGLLQLKYFLRMIHTHRKVDWPLYLFESHFNEGRQGLLADWLPAIPACFAGPNALWAVPPSYRPPGRYFLVGSKRSGSYVHRDPCETSAWNLLLHGRKRWAILPPATERHIIEPLLFTSGPPARRLLNRCPAAWFHFVLPKLRDMNLGLLEFTQFPGETVYIPHGWWHAVLNLDDFCICATENFISTDSLEAALQGVRDDDPSVAEAWREELGVRGWSCKQRPANKDDSVAQAGLETIWVPPRVNVQY